MAERARGAPPVVALAPGICFLLRAGPAGRIRPARARPGRSIGAPTRRAQPGGGTPSSAEAGPPLAPHLPLLAEQGGAAVDHGGAVPDIELRVGAPEVRRHGEVGDVEHVGDAFR